jgi:hypothetical protein
VTGDPTGPDVRSGSFPLPDSLTLAGRQAFSGAVHDYADHLSAQLAEQALHHHRPASVYTTQDVHAAKYAYEQRLREQEDGRGVTVRGLVLPLLLGAVVLGGLANFTTGIVQAALLGLFVAAETAGLLLIWRAGRGSGPTAGSRAEPARPAVRGSQIGQHPLP